MGFWDGKPGSAANIRLYHPQVGWRAYADKIDAEGRVTYSGCSREVELSLTGALNSSNLAILTGAGASFCIKNPVGAPGAPGMGDLWDAVEKRVSAARMKEVLALIPKAKDIGKNIEKLMTLAKIYVSLFDGTDAGKVSVFIEQAEAAILERVDFVTPETDIASHRNLVRKIARRGNRKPRTKIFTTNYDLCFEYAAQAQRFVVIDGFSHSQPQVYDRSHFSYDTVRRGNSADGPDYIENVFHLYKLHGSLDWRRRPDSIIRGRDATDGSPVLIYPRDTKYQEAFEAPYLDMMSAFQTAIREPDTSLIVSGFGFNDDHIAKPIIAALEANMSLRLIICDVTFITDPDLLPEGDVIHSDALFRSDNPYFKAFKDLANRGDPRVTLLSGRFEDLAHAIPDLVAQTERERHSERMQALMPGTGTAR